MKTALITCLDDRVVKNFEKDFLPTLFDCAKYDGTVFAMYYGRDDAFIKRINKKFNVVFLKLDKSKKAIIPNQRYFDLPKVFNILPKEITNIMLIDSGDVWFQGRICDLFEITKNSYGFVFENMPADEGFNKNIITQIRNKELRRLFLESAQNKNLINGGMIVGDKMKIKDLATALLKFLKKSNEDIFALDQTILNYIIYNDGTGISLDKKYNFSLISRQNEFFVKEKIIYENDSKEPVVVVHNSGGENRLFKGGRVDLYSVPLLLKDHSGSFWGVTAFFNPAGYKNKAENYRRFRDSSKKQGLKLLAIECAFGDKPFELNNDDADKLIQIRTNSALWQKERLLNVGIENLPDDCDRFAWLDADIMFLNDNWVKETSDLLNEYAIVQPFSTYVRLGKNVLNLTQEQLEKIPFSRYVDIEGKRFFGVAYKVSQLGPKILAKTIHEYGHAGLAWAARREIFQKNGLFDKSLLSAVDMLMAHLFYNNKLGKDCDYYVIDSIKRSLQEWSEEIYPKIKGSVYYADGAILHLWHGAMERRNNEHCKAILNKYNFDPKTDIKKDAQACWVWSSHKPGLHKAFKRYFFIRDENDSFEIKFLVSLEKIYINFLSFCYYIYLKIDRAAGLAGLAIKRISPTAYEKIKRIKELI